MNNALLIRKHMHSRPTLCCNDVKFLDGAKLFEAQHFSAFYDITTYVERCKSFVKHLSKTYPLHVIEKTTT